MLMSRLTLNSTSLLTLTSTSKVSVGVSIGIETDVDVKNVNADADVDAPLASMQEINLFANLIKKRPLTSENKLLIWP